MEEQQHRSIRWHAVDLWQMPTVLQTSLCLTLVGPISKASIDCRTISGDDPLRLEAWTWQLSHLNRAADTAIDMLRAELDRAIGSLSPF